MGRRTMNPIMLALVMSMSAGLLSVVVLWRRSRAWPVWGGLILVTLILFQLTRWIFFSVPAAVIASADSLAGDAPFCIVLSGQHRAVQDWLDITPLRMLGGHLEPHAVLLIATPQGHVNLNWSYNRGRFVENRHLQELDPQHACEPKIGFLDTLTRG
jgi:hypothetical protein